MLIFLISLTWMPLLACKNKGQSIIGLETGHLIKSNELEILAGHSISKRWALKGGCRLNLKSFSSDGQYSEHMKDLGYGQDGGPDISDNIITTYIAAEFWVSEAYKGPFISIGVCSSRKGGTGLPISIGYACPIWKGLGCRLSYVSDIIRRFRYKSDSSEVMSLGLTYSF